MIDATVFALVAGAGAMFACWSQIKSLATRLTSRLVTMVSIEESSLSQALRAYCFANLRQSKFGIRQYSGLDVFVRPLNGVRAVAIERIGAAHQVFWRGWRPLWIKSDPGADRGMMKLCFLRGTFDAEALMLEALEQLNSRARSGASRRYRVTHVIGRGGDASTKGGDQSKGARPHSMAAALLEARVLGWGLDELGPPLSAGSPVDELVLPDHVRLAVEEARFWRRSEAWYRERRIHWKRGWLIHGPPGTGKTSVARAVAEELDLPVFAYDLSSLTNEELRSAWSQMLRDSPCMALIEDIDGVFHHRRNVTGRASALSFDALLNCIDGVERSDGVFLVMTTNDIAHVDPAIGAPSHQGESSSSRPGRTDRVIELGLPDESGLGVVCRRILPDRPDLWVGTIRQGLELNETIAQFQERCARIALMLYWSRFGAAREPVPATATAALNRNGGVRPASAASPRLDGIVLRSNGVPTGTLLRS